MSLPAARVTVFVGFASAGLFVGQGCTPPPDGSTAGSAPKPAAITEPVPNDGPDLIKAGQGDAAEVVRNAMDEAEADGRRLVVYVGADWCEPCTRFHAAVENGELDATFPNLRFIEFDATADQERLVDAGYASKLIPLFCLPDADGKGGTKRIEGSIKGEGAVANITPRLQELLAAGG